MCIRDSSCGVPVVASRRGGIPEALDHSVGVLIEPEVDEIARVIEDLYNNPMKLENLRRNCRSYAEMRFSEKNAEIIIKSYENY